MIGIILAGGNGTRMHPATTAISKHLMPVYDKPMIYYPLSILMLMNIKKIIIITTSQDQDLYKKLLKNSQNLGLSITFLVQDQPRGIAESISISKKIIKNKKICLILGDNIFYGQDLKKILNAEQKKIIGATIFSYQVKNPKDFGIVEYNKNYKIISIKEKPNKIISNNAITGIYFFDKNVEKMYKKIKPSHRGELEITDLLNEYLKVSKVRLYRYGRGFVWFDAGDPDRLLKCSSFIETTENRTGLKIACIEEISLNNKWITKNQLKKIIKDYPSSNYKKYIQKILLK